MSDVKIKDYHDIKFTRNTKVDYKDGNAVINTIFEQYDTDLSGDFNDKEWQQYLQVMEEYEFRKSLCNKILGNRFNYVIKHYDSQSEYIAKKYEELSNKYKKINASATFDKLLEFEKEHPNVGRLGCKSKDEIPENAMPYNIKNFCMGIYDQNKDCYTGEVYTRGYITGLESLTPKEQKEYLRLLNRASKACAKTIELEEEFDKLNQEWEKVQALKDMTNSGIINAGGKAETEEQAYQKWINIRNEQNPFYKKIKQFEQERERLRLKGTQTSEDKAKIEQLNIQIEQLYIASNQWSVLDSNTQPFDNDTKIKTSMSLHNLSYSQEKNGMDITRYLSNSASANLVYSNTNLDITADINATQLLEIKTDSKSQSASKAPVTTMVFNPEESANLNIYYSIGDYSVSSSSAMSVNPSMSQFNQNVRLGYKNLSLYAAENINTMFPQQKSEDKTHVASTTHATTLVVSHQIGQFNNTATVYLSESGNTYKLCSDANFHKQIGEHSSININPNIEISYGDTTHSCTMNPNINTQYNYHKDDLNINVGVSEQYSKTFSQYSMPMYNLNVTGAAGVTYKGIHSAVKYNHMGSAGSTSNTYGAEITLNTKNAGAFALDYSYNNTQLTMTNSTKKTHQINLKYLFTFGNKKK